MKKIMMTLAAVVCCAIGAIAQDKVEQALKYAEEMAKQADNNPTDGKMQLKAVEAFTNNELGDKRDLDRALDYAHHALAIAKEQPVLKDTLMGLSCYSLGMIYFEKQNYEKAFEYYEKAMNAFEQELGKEDPITNGTKLIFGTTIAMMHPFRGFPKVLEAFYYNSVAPQYKRIENMDEANIAAELAMEMLLSEYVKLFRYALPRLTYNGKKYLLVQTKDWNMEKPLVGWTLPSLLRTKEEGDAFKGDPVIIADEDMNFTVMPDEEKENRQLMFNFKQFFNNPKHLEGNEDDARLWFLPPEAYNTLLTKFREYKARKN